MRDGFRSFGLVIAAAASVACFAEGRLTCDMVALANVSNGELEARVAKVLGDKGIQCGIPGETLRVCGSCAEATSEDSMRVLRPVLAEAGHVAWHTAWHSLRLSQDLLTEADFKKAQDDGFIPTQVTYSEFRAQHIVGGTLSGEDFLAMHRLMIKMVQVELSEHKLPCFAPWTEIPGIDDAVWPVPKPRDNVVQKQAVEQEWNLINTQLKKLKNPLLLKNISLNRLGQLVEPNMHQNLHHLYQSVPLCSDEAKAQGYCDDLIPFSSSPLNKHFWKLHGLVDGLIGDWLNANGYSEISDNCEGRMGCYQWGAVWRAPVGHDRLIYPLPRDSH